MWFFIVIKWGLLLSDNRRTCQLDHVLGFKIIISSGLWKYVIHNNIFCQILVCSRMVEFNCHCRGSALDTGNYTNAFWLWKCGLWSRMAAKHLLSYQVSPYLLWKRCVESFIGKMAIEMESCYRFYVESYREALRRTIENDDGRFKESQRLSRL